jgi:hypothetical protein
MPSDYEAITQQNLSDLGTKTSTRKTQICMYSDLTHFVYELLQNADDYGATEVYFRLTPTQVVVEHNGQPFTSKNVLAITSFGESTSRGDMLRTGRFGVGFKSVFAFTATPIILSGDEHFMIHKLYRVSEYAYPEELARDRTRIVLPFNHETEKPDYVEELMSAKEAFDKISDRLTGLNMHTLLFTRNLREIRWEIGGAFGHYLREDKPRGTARETSICDGPKLDKYLVFSRTPTWCGQSFKDVEIAFGLDETDQVSPIEDFLYVLFGTKQETHLQFILNGPYKTNPSRENISEEDPFNRHLMGETCALLGEILPRLRDDGMLNTQTLGVLPNASDNLRPFYAPLLSAVIARFQSEKLVPTDDGQYAPVDHVFQGPAAVREVLGSAELAFFAQTKTVFWAKGVSQNTRPDQFLRSLNIRQWGYAELDKAITSKYGGYSYSPSQLTTPSDSKWISERQDEWLQKLYILLGDALTKRDCNEATLQRCRIVRVLNNKTETHVAGTKAFFPKGNDQYDLPQIKSAILRGKNPQQAKKIEDSLVALGARQIGDEERIDFILATYYGKDTPKVVRQQHIEHMGLFIKWWKKEHSASKFAGKPIFRTVGDQQHKTPASCYIDVPLKATGMDVLYREPRKGITQMHKLWFRYRELNAESFCDFAIACGATTSLSITWQSCCFHPTLCQDCHRCSRRFTGTGIADDFIIPELKPLLCLQSVEVNQLIWDTVCNADPKYLVAKFRPNRKHDPIIEKSSLILILASTAWIPDKTKQFHKAADITQESLHPSFHYDNRNGWLDAIGFGENAQRASVEYKHRMELAKELGVDPKLAERISALPAKEREEMQNQFLETLEKTDAARRRLQTAGAESVAYHEALAEAFARPASREGQESAPAGGESTDPKRRRERIVADVAASLDAEPSLESRVYFGVCRKWKGKDDSVRVALLTWYAGRCQICGETFTKRNGTPYFEGVYLVPYTRAEWLDRVGNVVCVCARHSAMLQFGPLEEDAPILDQILAMKTAVEGGSPEQSCLCLTLCGEQVNLRYAEKHFIDLQEMIKASQKASGGA